MATIFQLLVLTSDPHSRFSQSLADDGSKVVVFGGTPGGEDFYNTIYILDVESGKWKKGESAPVARTRMACAIHSYQFVAWGGSSGVARTTMLNNLPVVYNLNGNKWTDNYDVNEKVKSSSVGTIIGVVIALAAIGAGLAFFVFKRRQKRRAEADAAYHSDAMTAAAIESRENVLHDDANVKVAVNSSYGNIYAMNPIDGHHAHGYTTASSTPGSEKMTPYLQGSLAGTPRMQSPPAAHLQYHDANPFTSPDDFIPPPPSLPYHNAPGSPQQSPNPFMHATMAYAAKATPYQSTAISSKSDPFQQAQGSPAYSQTTTYYGHQSPMPGARSPQVIPGSAADDSNDKNHGYVPPPM